MKSCYWIIAIGCMLFSLGSITIVTGTQIDTLVQAGEQGSTDAQIRLGRRYLNAIPIKRDTEQAYFWYKKAAEQNDPRGQTAIGWMFEAGLGVTKNTQTALSWYQKAADQGYANGQFRLGRLYENGGQDVTQNLVLTAKWLKEASSQGHAKAKLALARISSKLPVSSPANKNPKITSKPTQEKTAPKSKEYSQQKSLLQAKQPKKRRAGISSPSSPESSTRQSTLVKKTRATRNVSTKVTPPLSKKLMASKKQQPSPSFSSDSGSHKTPHSTKFSTKSTLISIFTQAKKSDPLYLSAQQQLAAQREGLIQATAVLWPTISLDGEYAKNYQEIISSDNTVYASGNTSFASHQYTLSLTQPIFAYASMVRVSQAKLEVKLAEVEEKILSQDLVLRVVERYLQALAATDELSFTRTELKSVTRQYNITKEKQHTGLARSTDLHDAKARLAYIRARELAAENILEDALQGIKEITGILPETLAGLLRDIPLLPPEPKDIKSWVKAALGQNLSLAVKKQSVEIARAEIKRQHGGHYPTLELVGRHNNSLTEGTLFGGGSEVETSDILLKANLPIFRGGYVNSKVNEATSLYNKARYEFEQESRSIQRIARGAYSGVLSAISQVEALHQALESQQLALESKKEGVRSGIYTTLAILDAERDLYMARRDYAKARYDYLLNTIQLKKAVGTLSNKDVTAISNLFE